MLKADVEGAEIKIKFSGSRESKETLKLQTTY